MPENPGRDRDASRLNCPYARAMHKFMDKLPDGGTEPLADKDRQFLTNLLQGLVLQHITKKICLLYEAEGISIEKKLTQVIMNFLSKNLFAHFRNKITENPGLILEASRKFMQYLLKSAAEESGRRSEHMDRYFLSILRKYFLSEKFQDLLEWAVSGSEIKNEILLHRFKNQVADPVTVDLFENVLVEAGDEERAVFERYLDGLRILRLIDMLKGKEWEVEAKLNAAGGRIFQPGAK